MPTRQTTEQKRAKSAWDNLVEIEQIADKLANRNEDQKLKENYASLARRLPALIQTNGLGQALAFLKAKGENKPNKPQSLLYRHLSTRVFRQLTNSDNPQPLPGGRASTNDLLEWLINSDSATYRRATTEALAYALWLRRFAEAKGWGEEGQGGTP